MLAEVQRMSNEDCWPFWPFLPVKRLRPNGAFPETGTLFRDPGKEIVIYDFNIFMMPDDIKESDIKYRYPDFEAVIADGWLGD